MSTITITESELSRFFEMEPRKLDDGIPWPYNQFIYEVEAGGLSLSLILEPAAMDVQIILKRNSVAIFTLEGIGVEDLIYREDKNSEVLELIINSRNRLWLRLKPNLEIIQEARKDV